MFIFASAGVGVIRVLTIIGFAWTASQAVVQVFMDGETLTDVLPLIALAAVFVVVRSFATWLSDFLAARLVTVTKRQLRAGLLDAVSNLDSVDLQSRSAAEIATISTKGLDALDAYFSKYLPQLVLTAIATPIFIVVIWSQDWLSGLVTIITMPLIPIFMILIGLYTTDAQKRQWDALTTLAGHFLDVVEGLSTLKVFGRERHQLGMIGKVTDQYRKHTMRVLRVSFLSGFALELIATLSVAVIAVFIGTRLIAGTLTLDIGLFVLLIAPEAFNPLRNVGAQFHAASEGLEAAGAVLDIIEAGQIAKAQPARVAELASTINVLEVSNLSVTYGQADTKVVAVRDFNLVIPAGQLIVLAGPSGAGKSSVIGSVLGFVDYEGSVTIAGPGERANAKVSWSGQQAQLFAGTVRSNVTLGDADPDEGLLAEALRLAALDPAWADHSLESQGQNLSGGQAQRVALARAYYRLLKLNLKVLLLDEPTSALDSVTEAEVLAGWRELTDRYGRGILAVSHRRPVFEAADQLIRLEPVEVSA